MPEPEGLSIWVVYDSPADFMGLFVARRHVATGAGAGATKDIIIGSKLEPLREEMERRGLTRLHRFPEDDDHIVETWL